jgi:hypothetical protein
MRIENLEKTGNLRGNELLRLASSSQGCVAHSRAAVCSGHIALTFNVSYDAISAQARGQQASNSKQITVFLDDVPREAPRPSRAELASLLHKILRPTSTRRYN